MSDHSITYSASALDQCFGDNISAAEQEFDDGRADGAAEAVFSVFCSDDFMQMVAASTPAPMKAYDKNMYAGGKRYIRRA